MKILEAGALETVVLCVYLDGYDVTNEGRRAYVAEQPGIEVEGWVDLYIFHPDGFPEVDEDDEFITVREYGKIRWEYE